MQHPLERLCYVMISQLEAKKYYDIVLFPSIHVAVSSVDVMFFIHFHRFSSPSINYYLGVSARSLAITRRLRSVVITLAVDPLENCFLPKFLLHMTHSDLSTFKTVFLFRCYSILIARISSPWSTRSQRSYWRRPRSAGPRSY